MLSLVGGEIESSGSAFRKTKGTTQARREQQAREQGETASSWLDPAISHIRRRDGKKHPTQLCRAYSGKASLDSLRAFCVEETGSARIHAHITDWVAE